MKNLSLVLSLLASAPAFAQGEPSFQCSDHGVLTLKAISANDSYASLEYADGSASTLSEIKFRPDSLQGTMLSDDSDGLYLGQVYFSRNGKQITLQFQDGTRIACSAQ